MSGLNELNFDQEARLFTTAADREKYENLATVYGLVLSLEYVERAYIRDAVPQTQYTTECQRLIARYQTIVKLLDTQFISLDAFVAEYKMDANAAMHRLRIGVPATVEHASESSAQTARFIAETTQGFITLMDALKLNIRAKDRIQPLLAELMTGYSNFPTLANSEWRAKLVQWLIKLNGMRASEEILEDQSRQMAYDVEQAYAEFFKALR